MKHALTHRIKYVLAFIVLTFGITAYGNIHNPSTAFASNTCSDVYAAIPTWITNAIYQPSTFQDGNFTNISAYQSVSNSTGVPWQMLAAIHYRETNFSHTNPSNGQGIFQFVNGDGGPYPPGPVTYSNFMQQLTYMAQRVQSDYVYRGSLAYTHRPLTQNEPDDFRVQDTLYSYNGRADVYAQQGVQYGFNASTQPYEGSPYVMNMFDCARANMGIITQDYGSIDGVDTRYGAFTLYTRLKSDSYWQSRYDFLGTNTKLSLPGCNAATNTTLNCTWKLEQLGTGAPAMASSIAERDLLITYGYKLDGSEFLGNVPQAPQPGNIPVYELQGSDGLDFFTADQNEMNTLVNSYGYKYIGIGFHADPANSNAGYPVYRLYSASQGRHLWVQNTTEEQQLLNNGYVSEGTPFNAISGVRQETPAPTGQSLVYRFYIPATYSHFWTTDIWERDAMISAGYTYEGVAWNSLMSTGAPVYRLYAPTIRQHLWTNDVNEKNSLVASGGWNYEGISQYVNTTPNNSPVYRLYAPSLGVHLYTSDANERNRLLSSRGWNNEGIAWYQP